MYNILPEHSAKNHKVTLKKKRKKNPEGGEKGLKLSESISVPLTRYSHMIQFLGILALYHDHARKKDGYFLFLQHLLVTLRHLSNRYLVTLHSSCLMKR